MDGQNTFSIGHAAEASGLTVKTIRYYEEIGLIPKAGRIFFFNDTAATEIYTEGDVDRLRFIHHARLFGLRLADIRELLALADGKGCPSRQPEYQKILGRHLHGIDERIRHLLGLRAAIEKLMLPAGSANARECSWGTCACMKPAQPASSNTAA